MAQMLGQGLAWGIESGCSSCHMGEPGVVLVPARPEAAVAVAQGWGGDFYSLL